MATAGYTSIGASGVKDCAGNIRGQIIVMTEAAAAGFSIWAYIESGSSSDQWRACLKTVGTGDDTILASSAIRTGITAAGWYEFDGGDFTSYSLAATTYWAGVVADTGTCDLYADNPGSGGGGWNAGIFSAGGGDFDPLTVDEFGSETDAAEDRSIYIEYTAAGGATGRGRLIGGKLVGGNLVTRL